MAGALGRLTVTLTAPTSGSTIEGSTTTVTGTTTPGASVVIASDDTGIGTAAITTDRPRPPTPPEPFSAPVGHRLRHRHITAVAATTACWRPPATRRPRSSAT